MVHTGAAQAGGANTITLAAGASATNDLYVGEEVKVYTGTGAAQTRTITAYNGTTKVATVDRAWITQPVVDDKYAILATDSPKLDSALQVSRVTLVDTLTTYTGNTLQTGDSFARLGAPAGASIAADIATRATPAQVNTEVLDVLNVDTFAEPGQEAPPATTTLVKKLGYLFKAWRNRTTQSATAYKLYNDDAVTVDQKATTSDDATVFDRQEIATGP